MVFHPDSGAERGGKGEEDDVHQFMRFTRIAAWGGYFVDIIKESH